MPWGDRSGPMGMGPMTGRGAGFCAGNNQPGAMTPGWGYGRGRGFGRGFGRGRGPGFGPFWRGGAGQYGYGYAPGPAPAMSPEQEKSMLQQEAHSMRDALASLEQRIADLESSS